MDLTVFSHSFIMLFYLLIICYIYKRLLTPRENLQHVFLFSFLVMTPDLLVSILNYHLVVYVHWLVHRAASVFLLPRFHKKAAHLLHSRLLNFALWGAVRLFHRLRHSLDSDGKRHHSAAGRRRTSFAGRLLYHLSDTVMALLAASFLKVFSPF